MRDPHRQGKIDCYPFALLAALMLDHIKLARLKGQAMVKEAR
jgi:hypothetical protein